MVIPTTNGETRQDILRAALKRFAHGGYAATSVQQIVDDAKVSKPTLYYYFSDKAELFQALVNEAHDERYRRIQDAVKRAKTVRAQLVEILVVLFDYFRDNRELMRISLATAFASPGEVPEGFNCSDRCERNFELVHAIIKKGLVDGEFDSQFESRELAFGFYGQANAYLMMQILAPESPLDRALAERIVELFYSGAAAKKATKPKSLSRK
ncbi:MAG: TetR/AcrR family transcriptional regulator [Verrucomicrobiota bacterium]